MNHSISCDCHRLTGVLQPVGGINHCLCYCADCQAFARFLGHEARILDAQGGTRLIQTLPAGITFTRGIEHLACMRLTDKGMLRWYASCCQTPIGNTLASHHFSFVGLVHRCLEDTGVSLEKRFGPLQMVTHVKAAVGEPKPVATGVLTGTLRVMRLMLGAHLTGRHRHTPFFDTASGAPAVTARVLTPDALARYKTPSSQGR
ncbi:DUF6151 family protein [Kushneria sp. AK178]